MSDSTLGGVPRCVLLPGLDGTGRLFDPLLAALGSEWPIQVMRYPPDPNAGYAELLNGLLEQLATDTPLFIVAESFSGPLAIQLALHRPQQVRGVMLCCTFAANPRPGLRWASSLLPCLPLVKSPSWPMLRLLMGRYGSADARGQMVDVVAGLPADLVRSRLAAVLAVDLRASLAQVTQPVWLLEASDDALVPAAATLPLRQGLVSVQHTMLTGPHALLQACPEDVAAVLRVAWQRCFAEQLVEGKPS